MNAKQLKKWKEKQQAKAYDIINSISEPHPDNITDIYPEFCLEGAYTTSLDPYTPVWAIVPFFKKIIVGITPYLKTEKDFIKWYGVTVKQLLKMKEMDRVEIRVIYPYSTNTVPKYLNCFFNDIHPSTIRDKMFANRLIDNEKRQSINGRFQKNISDKIGVTSVDGFQGNRKRAINTAQAVYLQLFSLGFEEPAYKFDDLVLKDIDTALKWLELCRLFLIGPIHYSLNGIHCVSQNAPSLSPFNTPQVIKFPSELGKILVDAMDIVRFQEVKAFTLQDCLSVYPDYESCRIALLELDKAINCGKEKHAIKSANDLKELIEKESKKNRMWIHLIKTVASTGIGIAALPLDVTAGILTALGFNATSEFLGSKIDKHLNPIVSKVSRRKTHMNLILRLDADIKKKYQIKE